MANDIGVLILAGGLSSRMGVNKAFLPVEESTLIKRLISEFSKNYDIYLSVRDELIYKSLNVNCIVDIMAEQIGPMGGIYSGLLKCSNEYLFVVPCDMPLINRKHLEYLAEPILNGAEACCYKNDYLQPTVGIYKKSCAVYFEQFIKDNKFSLRNIATIPNFVATDISNSGLSDADFINLNTMGDYYKFINSI